MKEFRREMKDSAKEPSFKSAKGEEPKDSLLSNSKLTEENSLVKEFLDIRKEYKDKAVKTKGSEREAATLALLAKFQNKVRSATETFGELEPLSGSDHRLDEDETEDLKDNSWLVQILLACCTSTFK